jgi:hypothetical protein
VWKFCWCYALPKWFLGKRKYLIVRWSKHIRFIPHVMLADEVAEIEESVPEGPKKDGWAGVWHALTAKWEVRKGRDD